MRRIITFAVMALVVGCGGSTSTPTPTVTPFIVAPASPMSSPTAENLTPVGTMSPSWPFVTPVPVGSNEWPTLAFVDAEHSWVARGKNLVATTDGGQNWELRATLAGTIYSVDFLSTIHGWVATDQGLFSTDDGGATWQHVTAAPKNVSRVKFVDSEHGWIDAIKQGLLATDDGGRSWTKATAPCYPQYGPPAPFAGLFDFINPQDGWTLCNAPVPGAGMRGRTMYRTADGGHTWTLIAEGDLPGSGNGSHTPTTNALPTSRYSSDLFMLDSSVGWIADNAGIFETTDGGRTWKWLGPSYLSATTEAETWRGPWAVADLDGYFDVHTVLFFTRTHGFALREEQDNPGHQDVAHEIPVLYETIDGGNTWTQVQCGFGSPCVASTPTPLSR
jgi:photosystem II stability/assembly factor-like uncharacterized protein